MSEARHVSTEGPCLECGKHICYGKKNKQHKKQGDVFLQDIRDSWQKPSQVVFKKQRIILINGHGHCKLRPYLCAKCRQSLCQRPGTQEVSKLSSTPRKQARKVRLLPYQEFLKTDFWQDIRKRKLQAANFSCEDCRHSGSQLDVHHLTYRHHGKEDKHLDELRVLCRNCHSIEHGKSEQCV